jgi:hypothetical protein
MSYGYTLSPFNTQGSKVSGGSYQYAYSRIQMLGDEIELRNRDIDFTPYADAHVWDRDNKRQITGDEAAAIIASVPKEREWFIGLLNVVAKAAHDIEWVDSGDYGIGDEVAAIRECRAYLATGPKP